jgi:gamma-glutamylcyclotransferase (GGCT)/AIG2-like uncharacterized protein YtfP
MTPPPTGEPDPPRLFVYGTLMPGRLRWPILERFAVASRDARVPGTIYDSAEGWPVAVFADRDEVVPGVLVDLDPSTLDQALQILDDVEDTATDTLRRIIVTTTEGDAAWAYHHPAEVVGLERIDAWHQSFPER